jgi:hypothetical protein
MNIVDALTELDHTTKTLKSMDDERHIVIADANELAGLIAHTLVMTQDLPKIPEDEPQEYSFIVGSRFIQVVNDKPGWRMYHRDAIVVSKMLELKDTPNVD